MVDLVIIENGYQKEEKYKCRYGAKRAFTKIELPSGWAAIMGFGEGIIKSKLVKPKRKKPHYWYKNPGNQPLKCSKRCNNKPGIVKAASNFGFVHIRHWNKVILSILCYWEVEK
jgi:hypothetical protein